MLACELAAGARIAYERSPRAGLEHHLLMLEGELSITVDGQAYRLVPGDCLRYQLFGASEFSTPAHTGVIRFRPAFIDVSGTVLRLADRPMRHVVHADAAAPGFRIGPGDSGEIRVEILPTVGGA